MSDSLLTRLDVLERCHRDRPSAVHPHAGPRLLSRDDYAALVRPLMAEVIVVWDEPAPDAVSGWADSKCHELYGVDPEELLDMVRVALDRYSADAREGESVKSFVRRTIPVKRATT
jgi:hypothetical protein